MIRGVSTYTTLVQLIRKYVNESHRDMVHFNSQSESRSGCAPLRSAKLVYLAVLSECEL